MDSCFECKVFSLLLLLWNADGVLGAGLRDAVRQHSLLVSTMRVDQRHALSAVSELVSNPSSPKSLDSALNRVHGFDNDMQSAEKTRVVLQEQLNSHLYGEVWKALHEEGFVFGG